MSDESLYGTIAAELDAGVKDSALWAQALVQADGDADKTKAAYIRLRLQALKKAAVAAAALRFDGAEKSGSDDLSEIRRRLAGGLLAGKMGNFYHALGIEADATDDAVRRAITERETEIAGGQSDASASLLAYAKDTLGNPQAREAYDRKLYGQLQPAVTASPTGLRSSDYVQAEGIFLPWWASKKTSVLIAVVALVAVGYMLLDFKRESGGREVERATIEAQREAARAAAESERERVANERLAIDGQIHVIDKAIDRSAELQNRALAIEERDAERRRQELEYRANAGSQLLELERERQRHQMEMEQERMRAQERRAEQSKADRQRLYWACMNEKLDRMDSSAASARCASYR